MKKIISIFVLVLIINKVIAQPVIFDSLQKAKEDSAKWARLETKFVYPVIKAGKWSGAIPVGNSTEIPDTSINYKLLFELVINNKASAASEINHGLTEICRIINLHAAAGIPVKNITPVVVVHGPALFSFYSNPVYQIKYLTANPNIEVTDALIKKTGARFIACGQAMYIRNITKDELLPVMKLTLSAQTVLSSYQLKGYVLYEINEDRH